ncbi:Antagonist of MEN (Mitotic Exit Network) [Scheffersomyces spartinae]|uniref:Antagonist of MEN (Mitotic Exit Network) n=1 Tax=Scheffersomyces spartinae TaxID=45513 RepID=A0A9P8AGI0_9ASCO|nr:Antagonist of MEN (Mitotic Exit Network) [Scheffersomyces spartinae]KAG7191754.1 Antagonist of MEN (Mitotic Exit Network) [Scheffersomyces spartinae]
MITPFTANKTAPLPFAYKYDNQIYDFNPYVSPSGHRRKKQRRNSSMASSDDSDVSSDSDSKPTITLDKMKIDVNFANEVSFFSESSSSDLDSLPDYSDDDFSPFSDVEDGDTTTGSDFSSPDRCDLKSPPLIKGSNINSIIGQVSELVSEPEPEYQPPSIFEVPEIVYRILKIVDVQTTHVPQEVPPVSRNSCTLPKSLSSQQLTSSMSGTLYNCLMVNRLFYQITKEILNEKIIFSNEGHFNKFVDVLEKSLNARILKPKVLVLHKLFTAKQKTWEILKSRIDYSNIEHLELYMCPKLYPQFTTKESTLQLEKLRKLVVTGSRVLDDKFLINLSETCCNLQTLDIRACELVSDYGIYFIGQRCTQLKEINFGRKNRGSLITDLSCSVLIRNNKQLKTVGFAGCHISDKSIWDLAVNCNTTLERLSLNNCPLITNQLIPLILHSDYFERMSVLELRYVSSVTNWKPVIEFKRRQEFRGISMLIEVCDDLNRQMKKQELEMDKCLSKRIFRDIVIWMNELDDGDLPYQTFVEQQLQQQQQQQSVQLK